MQFELTDEVVNQLIFSMEDQSEKNAFDSVQQILIETRDGAKVDSDRYYSLPVWDSISGFKVMEQFVSVLRSPLAREKLCSVLFIGKGVFRNFKNVLKEYPEVEHLWFIFKQKEMKKEIIGWYNVLRDSWGLERIEGEPEETGELIQGDFIFREHNGDSDVAHILVAEQDAVQILEDAYPGELGFAATSLWKLQKKAIVKESEFTLVSETAEGEFSGFISAAPLPTTAKKTVVFTAFFILPAWRGLGIGKELFFIFLQKLQKRGIRWILILDMFIPETFTKVLLRSGFKKTDIGFIADLLETQYGKD